MGRIKLSNESTAPVPASTFSSLYPKIVSGIQKWFYKRDDGTEKVLATEDYVQTEIAAVNAGAFGWDVDGNAAVPGNFLGTTNLEALPIKTNGVKAAEFDINQRFGLGADSPLSHFYQKTHTGFSDSGVRKETFSLTTANGLLNSLYAMTIPDQSVARFKVKILGRQADGGKRCYFERSGLFFREGSSVQVQGSGWQSDATFRSSNQLGCAYSTNITDFNIEVKNTSASPTHWVGEIEWQILKTNL